MQTLESRQLLSASIGSVVPKTVTASEGQFISPVIASFACNDPSLGAASFFADVDWRNGSHSTPGTIVPLGGGKFNVIGGHRYDVHGTYAVDVFIHIRNGFATTAHSVAQINNAPISMLGQKFTVNGGQSVSPVVATFSDPFPDSPSYSATIDWGDNSAKTVGVVSPVANAPGSSALAARTCMAQLARFPSLSRSTITGICLSHIRQLRSCTYIPIWRRPPRMV